MNTTHTLWSYDTWGNEEDGWEVNDRCALDRELELPSTNSTDERAILDAINAGPSVGIDWTQSDEYRIELTDRRNGKPIGCIERNANWSCEGVASLTADGCDMLGIRH